MRKLLFLLLLFTGKATFAQNLRVSLLTCGPGEEMYSSFGHAGVRVTDTLTGSDVVYNYGTFNGFEENFELKFMRGKLLYYLAEESFMDFLGTYVREGRWVKEQQLLLSQSQLQAIVERLRTNLLPQNSAYKYDFLYENCATRIRDLLPKSLGSGYKMGLAPHPQYTTFRQSIDDYLRFNPWTRLGIDMLLGRPVDKKADGKTMQYLPDFLSAGIGASTFEGKPVAAPLVELLPQTVVMEEPSVNVPMVLGMVVLLLNAICWAVPQLQTVAMAFTRIALFISGLLGCLMVFMWFGTDHDACGQNWNILWAIPINLFAAYFSKRLLARYAPFAMALTISAFIAHFIHFQQLPLWEIWPVLVLLLLNYGMVYRRYRANALQL
jgi:hypothetical protein